MAPVAMAQRIQHPFGPPLALGAFRLTVTEEHLSVEVNAAPVAKIFAKIGQETGIAMTIYLGAEEKITTSFDHVPLQDALKRLAKNVAFVYTKRPNEPPNFPRPSPQQTLEAPPTSF